MGTSGRARNAIPGFWRLPVALWIGGYVVYLAHAQAPILAPLFSGLAPTAALLVAVGCVYWAALRHDSQRAAWLLIATGLLLWTVGYAYRIEVMPAHHAMQVAHHDMRMEGTQMRGLSPADLLEVLVYPFAFAGLIKLLRPRREALPARVWLDALIAALAIGAVAASISFRTVISDFDHGAILEGCMSACPVADLLLVGLVVGVCALRGWRYDRAMLSLGAGLLIFWGADSHFVADNMSVAPSLFDVAWTGASVLVASAAIRWPVRYRVLDASGMMRAIFLPVGFATIALGVLTVSSVARVNIVASSLAEASLVAVIVRLLLTWRAHTQLLYSTRREAETDALTGLANRRRLLLDLRRLEDADEQRGFDLVLFDLDGFKRYNDDFGHPAGDALLARIGHSLDQTVGPYGRAYRMGGDEFCALIGPAHDRDDNLILDAARSLCEEGDGFSIRCSFGVIRWPDEACDAKAALQLVDQRMYRDKRRDRRTASEDEAIDPLAVVGRTAETDGRLYDVVEMAEAISRVLTPDGTEHEHVRHVAELHQIGKVALPDTILSKRGPLRADEWSLVRQHPIVAERILSRHEALQGIAPVVRSRHERFDGSGYPDSLIGEAIPLAARIVAVCDAFAAMVGERPYRAPLAPEAAMAELRRGAGAQFDPRVVEAFYACYLRLGRPAFA